MVCRNPYQVSGAHADRCGDIKAETCGVCGMRSAAGWWRVVNYYMQIHIYIPNSVVLLLFLPLLVHGVYIIFPPVQKNSTLPIIPLAVAINSQYWQPGTQLGWVLARRDIGTQLEDMRSPFCLAKRTDG